MRLRLHRLAVAEIDHEVDYYESRQTGLGTELEDEIDAVLAFLRRHRSGSNAQIDALCFSIDFRSRFRVRSDPRRRDRDPGAGAHSRRHGYWARRKG